MPRPDPGARAARRRGAFTLLEVLAAVAVLGLVYTVVAGSAIRGLRASGDTRRRIEASLIADRTLARLELGLEAGSVPAVGETEEEADEGFVIHTRVSPFEGPLLDALRPDPSPGGGAPPSLLVPSGPGAAPPLREIHVRVSWIDNAVERSVTRTTYAFDTEAVAELLGALGAPSEASDTGERAGAAQEGG